MKPKPQLLFLSLSTFNETGGIQNVCKTLCRVLTELSPGRNALRVISLKDNTSDADERYLSQSLFTGYACRKWSFSIMSIFRGLKSRVVILGHIHLLPLAVLIKLLNPGSKIILLAHGIEVWTNISRWKAIFLNHHTDIWAVSRYTKGTMVQQQLIAEKKIAVLNNCLDPFFKVPVSFKKPSYLLRRYQLQSDQPVLFSLNRLSAEEREKGYDQVLNLIPGLLKEFPNLCYLLGGSCTADESVRLQNQILNKKLSGHVKIIGCIHEREQTDHYLLADLFVLPSKKEGFGLVYIEAAACGCKIICGNRDGSTDAVLQGRLGDLTDPSNEDQLHRVIVNSLKKEHHPYQQQQLCLDHFSYKIYKQKVKTLLYHEF